MFGSFKAAKLGSQYGGALLLALSSWLGPGAPSGFAVQRTIEADMQRRFDAVAITKIMLGNSELQCGLVASRTESQPVTPFEAGDEWLQNVTIYLLNRTNKTIVYGEIVLWFPDTGDGGPQHPMRTYHIHLGRIPDSVAFTGNGKALRQNPTQQPITFAHDQTLTIHLSDYIDQIQAGVGKVIPIPTVTKLIIRRGPFVFSDGMMEWLGEYSVPDSDHPGKWKKLDANFFPGRPSWPPGSHS